MASRRVDLMSNSALTQELPMLKFPRAIAALVFLCVAAVVAASCGSPASNMSPTGPSASVTTLARASAEGNAGVSGTNFDDGGGFFEPVPEPEPEFEPEPAPAPGEPAPAPEPPVTTPEPAPAPAPSPEQPAPAPPAPAPAPGQPPAPAPPPAPRDPNIPVPGQETSHMRLKARIDPNPVPYSGRPVELFSCRDLSHTWFYTQNLSTETGVAVTITERENFFDGIWVSTTKQTIRIEGNNGHRIESRWCSGYDKAHTAQHRYKGKDDNGDPVVLMGALIRLLPSPNAPPPAPPATTNAVTHKGAQAVFSEGQ
jgi:hypothetical protein